MPVAPPAAASRAAAVPVLALNQPAQMAAQQDSIVPLLKNLAVLSSRLPQMPPTVADAAVRLLASPIVAERRLPAEVLKAAVRRAGVLLDPPVRPGSAPPDVKSSLLQLRAGLLALLEGHDVAPVATAARRPAPPLPDAQPRGMRPDGPTLNADAAPRDAARTLLHQTDGALSRLKLTQLASQPAEAALRAAASAPDFMVELPMVLGAELGLMQLKVQRDGKGRAKPGERGWRVRFAVSFSAIGEVGAQVALLGRTTNVTVWADRETTAAALEEMLPELGPALAARGLTVGAVRLRRGVPGDDTRPGSGRLMDTVT